MQNISVKKTAISSTGSQNYYLLKHNDNHITQQIHQLFITEMKPAKNLPLSLNSIIPQQITMPANTITLNVNTIF